MYVIGYLVTLATIFCAMGATVSEVGKEIQIPTPNAFSQRKKKPSLKPVFTRVRQKDIIKPMATAMMEAKI